jgi:hypothetical protein
MATSVTMHTLVLEEALKLLDADKKWAKVTPGEVAAAALGNVKQRLAVRQGLEQAIDAVIAADKETTA